MFNSIWTCIGPTSRLDLINILTIVYYLQCVKVVSVCQHTCVCVRTRVFIYNRMWLISLLSSKCVGALQFYRCGFLGVRYLEAILYKSRREFESNRVMQREAALRVKRSEYVLCES